MFSLLFYDDFELLNGYEAYNFFLNISLRLIGLSISGTFESSSRAQLKRIIIINGANYKTNYL